MVWDWTGLLASLVDWPDQTIIFSLDWTGPKNFSPVLDFWDWTVKRSPLFDGTGLYMVQSQNLETGLLNHPHYLMGPDYIQFGLKILGQTLYFGTVGP